MVRGVRDYWQAQQGSHRVDYERTRDARARALAGEWSVGG